jgi:drug/metabolite transporter (DMT)-like permease
VSWVAYPLALAASGSNATSNILQRAANRQEPPELSLRPRLLLDLVRRPLWLAGFRTVIVSFLLLAAALSRGRLATVDPIIVLELPLTLIGAARVFGSPLHRHEWLSIVAITCALGALLFFLDPSQDRPGQPSAVEWGLASAATVAAVGLLVAAAWRTAGLRRAALLGVAAGMGFGLTAAYMKGMTGSLHEGLSGVLTSWPAYAMAASGLASMYLWQSALSAGSLVASQPGVTLSDPIVAIVWGLVVFGEHPRGGPCLVLAAVSMAVLVAATIHLARSPLLVRIQAKQEAAGKDDRGDSVSTVADGPPARGGAS